MNLYIMQIVLFCFYKGIYNNYKYRISRDEYNMINIEYFIRSRKYTSGLPSVLYGPHIDHFVSICKDRKREGEKERQDERRISERMNGEKEVRGRRKKTRSLLVELDAWQIRFSNLRTRTLSGSPPSASSDAAAAAHRTVRANFNFNC